MKIAAFNVENLFDRAEAFNQPADMARRILADMAELNGLFEYANYTDRRKQRMVELLTALDLERSDQGHGFVFLRQIRERVVKRSADGLEIVADGRNDWVGWVEAKRAPVNDVAVLNTGRVIKEVDADVIAVVEAESRVALKMFSDHVLDQVGGSPYENVMVIDGNDDRGIDVGLMTRREFAIGDMRSHISDRDDDDRIIFSRDCPEYAVDTPLGRMWFLPNHFKSKFGGNNAASRRRRTAQSKRTAEIYGELRAAGEDLVVVLGDFNDTTDSDELRPLLHDTDLTDVSEFPCFDAPAFDKDRHPGKGTFGLGNDNDKIDFLMLSPALFDRVTAAGLFRKGAWPGSRPKRWEVFDELRSKVHVASDHHVIWAEVE
jgi:endonuclease/exonuclease/phosphatase family metal-dependent hydrolase